MSASAGSPPEVRTGEGASTEEPPRELDLVVVGEINPDIVVQAADPTPAFGQVERWVDAIDLVIGSSSVIMACGAARLGLATAVVGLVGDDALGRFMVAEMAAHGIDTSAVQVRPGVPTGASVILASRQDRAILTAPGSIPLLRATDVPASIVSRARHVHVGHAFLLDALRADLPELLAGVRAGGGTTSVDPNWDPTQAWDGGMARILEQCDVFLPNSAEAACLTGLSDPEAAARALVAAGPTVVVVKLGAAGALAVTADGAVWRVAAPRVDVVDTTGAGDSFDAGFVAGLLLGRPLPAALALAAACGSLSTRAPGGTAAQPTLPEADAAVAAVALAAPGAAAAGGETMAGGRETVAGEQ